MAIDRKSLVHKLTQAAITGAVVPRILHEDPPLVPDAPTFQQCIAAINKVHMSEKAAAKDKEARTITSQQNQLSLLLHSDAVIRYSNSVAQTVRAQFEGTNINLTGSNLRNRVCTTQQLEELEAAVLMLDPTVPISTNRSVATPPTEKDSAMILDQAFERSPDFNNIQWELAPQAATRYQVKPMVPVQWKRDSDAIRRDVDKASWKRGREFNIKPHEQRPYKVPRLEHTSSIPQKGTANAPDKQGAFSQPSSSFKTSSLKTEITAPTSRIKSVFAQIRSDPIKRARIERLKCISQYRILKTCCTSSLRPSRIIAYRKAQRSSRISAYLSALQEVKNCQYPAHYTPIPRLKASSLYEQILEDCVIVNDLKRDGKALDLEVELESERAEAVLSLLKEDMSIVPKCPEGLIEIVWPGLWVGYDEDAVEMTGGGESVRQENWKMFDQSVEDMFWLYDLEWEVPMAEPTSEIWM